MRLSGSIRPGGSMSRMIDNAVTLLPLPDSPTRPSVRPCPSERLTPSTARMTPAGVWYQVRRSSTRSSSDTDLNLRGRDVARRHHAIAIELQLEPPGTADLFTGHLGLFVRPAIEQDPGRLERVGVTDTERDLARVFASEPMHNVEHTAAKDRDA